MLALPSPTAPDPGPGTDPVVSAPTLPSSYSAARSWALPAVFIATGVLVAAIIVLTLV